MEITHKIVSVERKETRNSRSPMWACRTFDNEYVNIFQHFDKSKDSFHLFRDAGYADDLHTMQVGDKATWNNSPICVRLGRSSDGKWWEILECADRDPGAMPDPIFMPDLAWYRSAAIRQAAWLIQNVADVRFFDCETTGTGPDAEIISIAILDERGDIMLDELIRPGQLEAVARTEDITGINGDDLIDAAGFPVHYIDIQSFLDGAIWVAYNIDFDAAMIEQSCAQHNLAAIIPMGLHDAMKIYSKFSGNWDKAAQRWQYVKLGEAADEMGIQPGNAHNALDDAGTMYALIEAIANSGREYQE